MLKGILHPDDARRAFELGVGGIVVSNHGGRQVDGAIASLDALPAVRGRGGPRTAVLLDSGMRTGADVVKALALGADAVPLGRPYIYGLALGGQDGVRDVVGQHRRRARPHHGPVGVGSVAQIGPELLRTAS